MSRLKGITIKLYSIVEVGKDEFNAPICEEKMIEVNNVLVAPATSDDITNSINLYGKKVVYNLAIPKGDTNNWNDVEVEFFGERFKTFGYSIQGIENMIPLDWNKKVMVEKYG